MPSPAAIAPRRLPVAVAIGSRSAMAHATIAPPTVAMPTTPPLSVDLHEAARLTSLSAATLRRAIAAGELKAATVGARRVVRLIDLDDFLRRRAESHLPAIVPATVSPSPAQGD